jgi:nucleoid-associated protein YgaU
MPANVPPNFAETQPTATPNEFANNDIPDTVQVDAAQLFDLQSYLQQQNRPDLAQLGVTATQQEGILALQGIVPSFELRQALLEVAKSAPGVTTVNAVDLLLRPAANYVVQTGDTLWDISYRLYGDNKIAELLAANRDILPSAEALDVGMVLKVPPLQ